MQILFHIKVYMQVSCFSILVSSTLRMCDFRFTLLNTCKMYDMNLQGFHIKTRCL